MKDQDGIPVCRLAKKFAHPRGDSFLQGSVFAVTTRFCEDSSEEYRAHLKRDKWSVVLPELVFGP
jgi:ATP-dependent DNA helicase RecQ